MPIEGATIEMRQMIDSKLAKSKREPGNVQVVIGESSEEASVVAWEPGNLGAWEPLSLGSVSLVPRTSWSKELWSLRA